MGQLIDIIDIDIFECLVFRDDHFKSWRTLSNYYYFRTKELLLAMVDNEIVGWNNYESLEYHDSMRHSMLFYIKEM